MPIKTLLRACLFVSLVTILAQPAFSQQGYQQEVKKAAVNLYQSFDKIARIKGWLSFDDSARTQWNNLPVGLRARAGVSIGSMTDEQRKLVHRVLAASLSSQGYLKAGSIMHLDELLNRVYDSMFYKKQIDENFYAQMRKLAWSPGNYYFAFFGSPNDRNWGYKLEGHHLSVNFTFTGDELSVTPWFVGTDPAEYPNTEYAGWRVLGQEEDLGIKLVNRLTPEQQKKATMSTAVPGDIITAAESGKRLVDNWGIKTSELSKEQQVLVTYIVREFVFNLGYEKATVEYEKIVKAGLGNIYFGWIGPYDEHKAHYYVLNGPTFLIEFDNAGFGGNGNHIHAIWREKGNEYGEDVLKQHYLQEKH